MRKETIYYYLFLLKLESLRVLPLNGILKNNTQNGQIFRIGSKLYTRLFAFKNSLIVVLEK